jgi:GNAT superfamily N-acetyltransferase
MLNSLPETQIADAGVSSPAEILLQPPIHTAQQADAERCFEALTRAFENDPPSRWVWPDRQQYLETFPRFARSFGGRAIELGTAYYYEGFSGVALWLPPGVTPDDESLIRIIHDAVAEERREALFSIFEQMEGYHPHAPHWHLPLIGVDPPSQGHGIGSALQRLVLDYCDREKMLAYLEATSPRNIALYRRLGFEPLGRIQVADCPPIVPMLRRPRSRNGSQR